MKVFTWIVTVFLTLVVAGLVFVHFSPDYNMYIVRSGSMKPAINAGDMVIIAPPDGPLSDGIEEGSIVTYRRGQELITHRVLAVEGSSFLTKGDAVEDPDPMPISRYDIKGVYLFRIPGIGYFSNFVRTKTGWILIIVIPAIVLVAFLIRDIRKKLRSSREIA